MRVHKKAGSKTVLITGASGIIGSAIAKKFAAEGYTTLLVGRSPQALERRAKQIGGRSELFVADISKEREVKRLFQNVSGRHRSLEVLVTAAGVYGEIGTVEDSDARRWLDAVMVNLYGTMLSLKYALPLLKKSARGKVICFAGGGDGPLPHFTSYAASKGGVIRFVESVSKELLPLHIDINAISPGLVNSGFVRDLIKAGPKRAGKKKYEEAEKEVSGKRETVSPDHAAALAFFLTSRSMDGVHGKNFSAIWDDWKNLPLHKKEIIPSDIYNWRRVKPKDRGLSWK